MAAESVVPPIPSEAVLPLAGFLARTGAMSLPLVVVAATLGALAGALLLYLAGARLCTDRVRRWTARVPGTSPAEFDRALAWFERWGGWAVLLGRCVPLVRSLVSIPAGTSRMPLGRFVALTTLGSLVWNTVFAVAGYLLGTRWETVAAVADWFPYAVVAGALAWAVSVYVRRRRSRVKTAATSGVEAR